MKKLFYLSIGLIFTIFTSCKKDEPTTDKNDKDWDWGDWDKEGSSCGTNINGESIVVNGDIRQYLINVPSDYDSTSSYPILFNFHGFGGDANSFETYVNFNALVESNDFILVTPQGDCLDGASHWNAALDSPDNKSDSDDLSFFDAMLDTISNQFNIDNKRVYATGYSNGGMFSYAIACYRSEKITAIAAVSSNMIDQSSTCTPTHSTPVMIIHGTNDGVIPYNGGDGYNSTISTLSYWGNYNNTNDSTTSTTENIEHTVLSNGSNGASVELYKIINGDHIWYDFNYKNKSTNELIWEFLSQYNKEGLIE